MRTTRCRRTRCRSSPAAIRCTDSSSRAAPRPGCRVPPPPRASEITDRRTTTVTCARRGVAVRGQPEGVYGVLGGTYSGSDCCFDFGNSEVAGTDNGNGTMDALNFSRDCWDACGPAKGPWVQADL